MHAARVVLDTQVCLDLWLFADPRVAALRAALDAGALQPMRDERTRDEWRRVLRYPVFALEPTRCDALDAEYDARLTAFEHSAGPAPDPPLPRCTDPDDQPFLELALACGARALLTRDGELLRLARRLDQQGRFAILSPDAFAAWGLPPT